MKQCPICEENLRFIHYRMSERENIFWCPGCGEEWTGSVLRAIEIQRHQERLSTVNKLERNRAEENGAD